MFLPWECVVFWTQHISQCLFGGLGWLFWNFFRIFFEGMIPFMEGKGAGFQIIHQTLADSSRFFLNFISLLLLRDPGYCSRFPGQQRDVILQFMKGFKLAVL